MSFTAKDVQALRQSTGAGMMDAKKALEANGGDMEAAKQWLREKGLAQSAKRDDRDNNQGVVALLIKGSVGAIVQLKCETDFVASSEAFVGEANALAELVIAKTEAAVAERNAQLEDMKITLKEKIELGQVVRFEAAAGNLLESYTHIQGGRGVNAVLVELEGGNAELGHDIAVHIAFARPRYLTKDDVPADEIAKERGQSLAQMAVAWTLRDPRVTSSLIGASSVKQLEDTIGAVRNLSFTDDELARIDAQAKEGSLNLWAHQSEIA